MWRIAHQYDTQARELADRHYSRVAVGSKKFMPPGRMCVLVTTDGGALWGASWPFAEYVKRDYPGEWLCTHFRRESGPLASQMILTALAVTRYVWGDPPADGLVSMIDPNKVRPTMVHGKKTWGWTWLKVGFQLVGKTKKKGLLIYRIPPESIPPPQPPVFASNTLFSGLHVV